MIVEQSKVIQANEHTLDQFVPPGQSGSLAAAHKASMVKVIQDNTEASKILVQFYLPFLVIVAAPEPFVRTLSNILGTILGGVGAKNPMAYINLIGGIESDLEKIAGSLKSKMDSGFLNLLIPVSTKTACKYNVLAKFHGKVVIDDNSPDDKATLESYVLWDSNSSTLNQDDIQGEVNQDIPGKMDAHLNDQPGSNHDIATVYFKAGVVTDGGLLSTEFSAVYVSLVEAHLEEICPQTTAPAKEGPHLPPGKNAGHEKSHEAGHEGSQETDPPPSRHR